MACDVDRLIRRIVAFRHKLGPTRFHNPKDLAPGNAGRLAILVACAIVLASCVQPVHRVSQDEAFMKPGAGRTAWRKVAVLAFAGEPEFRRTAAEWLAFQVRRHGLCEIVGPSLAEIELGRKGVVPGEAGAGAAQARKAGELLGVDGVVFGSVDLPGHRQPARTGTVRAGVVDVASGKVVADSVRSIAAWGRHGEDLVAGDVSLVVQDLIPVFYSAAGKVWTPPKKDAGDQEPVPREQGLR